jgi:hypothetical protein
MAGAFEHDHFQAALREKGRGHEAIVTGADDDGVSHGWPTAAHGMVSMIALSSTGRPGPVLQMAVWAARATAAHVGAVISK